MAFLQVLSLGPSSVDPSNSSGLVLCRPKFSLFQKTSMDILDELNSAPELHTAYFPIHTRQREDK